jgi:hypothetical protein
MPLLDLRNAEIAGDAGGHAMGRWINPLTSFKLLPGVLLLGGWCKAHGKYEAELVVGA